MQSVRPLLLATFGSVPSASSTWSESESPLVHNLWDGVQLIVETPGGAGIGDPAERDDSVMQSDRRDGLVGEAAAE